MGHQIFGPKSYTKPKNPVFWTATFFQMSLTQERQKNSPCYNSKAFSAKSHNKRGNMSLGSQNPHKQTFFKAIEKLHTVNHEHYYLLVSLEFPTGRKQRPRLRDSNGHRTAETWNLRAIRDDFIKNYLSNSGITMTKCFFGPFAPANKQAHSTLNAGILKI